MKAPPFPSPKTANWQDRICSRCGNRVGESPYTCANDDAHAFCGQCVAALNNSDTGLNCPYCHGVLVT